MHSNMLFKNGRSLTYVGAGVQDLFAAASDNHLHMVKRHNSAAAVMSATNNLMTRHKNQQTNHIHSSTIITEDSAILKDEDVLKQTPKTKPKLSFWKRWFSFRKKAKQGLIIQKDLQNRENNDINPSVPYETKRNESSVELEESPLQSDVNHRHQINIAMNVYPRQEENARLNEEKFAQPYYHFSGPINIEDIPNYIKFNKDLVERTNEYSEFKIVEPPRQLLNKIIEMQKNAKPTLEVKLNKFSNSNRDNIDAKKIVLKQ